MNKKFQQAFTLIEVLVSVIIVSIVVVGAMQISKQNKGMASYLLKRSSREMDNALFLTKKIQRYSNDKKSAYDLLMDEFSIKDFESRKMLKKVEKTINITEPIPILVGGGDAETPELTFYTNEILLNGEYPTRYYTFR